MNVELEKISQIENYLLDQMTESEKNSFETNINSDIDLFEDVKIQKELQSRIALNAFKTDLSAFNTDINGFQKGKGFNIAIIVIVIALIFSSILYFINLDQKVSSLKNKVSQNNLLIPNNFEENSTPFTNQENDDLEKEIEVDVNKNNTKDKTQKANIIPKKLKLPFNENVINNQKGDTVIMKTSGSRIYIQPNSIQSKNGEIVEGEVVFKYREFREVSDMIFSEIPMIYSVNGENYQFNSAGMFEIRATKNGEDLEIVNGKPIIVDYVLVEDLDSLNFYHLDDKTQEWSYKHKVELLDDKDLIDNEIDVFKDTCLTFSNIPSYKGGFVAYNTFLTQHPLYIAAKKHGLQGYSKFIIEIDESGIVENVIIEDKKNVSLIDSIATIIFKELNNLTIGEIANKPVKMPITMDIHFAITQHKDYLKTITTNSRMQEYRISKKESLSFNAEMEMLKNTIEEYIRKKAPDFKMYFGESKKYEVEINGINYSKIEDSYKVFNVGDSICLTSNVKKTHYREKSKFYVENLISRIKMNKFRVGNCDQVLRIKNPVEIRATFIDENGKVLKPFYSTFVNLNLRASFPFSPSSFICSSTANTVFFLNIGNGQIYKVSSKEYRKQKVTGSGAYTFQAENVTAELKKPKDARKFLR